MTDDGASLGNNNCSLVLSNRMIMVDYGVSQVDFSHQLISDFKSCLSHDRLPIWPSHIYTYHTYHLQWFQSRILIRTTNVFLHTYLKGISIIFLTPYRETKPSTNANFGEKRTCPLARDEESWEELVPSNHVVHLDWIFLHSRRGAPSNNTQMIGGLIILRNLYPTLLW